MNIKAKTDDIIIINLITNMNNADTTKHIVGYTITNSSTENIKYKRINRNTGNIMYKDMHPGMNVNLSKAELTSLLIEIQGEIKTEYKLKNGRISISLEDINIAGRLYSILDKYKFEQSTKCNIPELDINSITSNEKVKYALYNV